MKKSKEIELKNDRPYNMNVFMQKRIRVENAIGVFTVDSKGDPLEIKKSGNGAIIPFLKRYIGKKAIVFVVE